MQQRKLKKQTTKHYHKQDYYLKRLIADTRDIKILGLYLIFLFTNIRI